LASPDWPVSRTDVMLVDHNALSPRWCDAGLGPRVVRIWDHHKDAGKHGHVSGTERWVEFDDETGFGCGSTATLVAQALLDMDGEGGAAAGAAIDHDIARVLLGVILLDTSNMDPSSARFKEIDTAVVARLKEVAGMDASECDALFHTLSEKKFDPEFWGSVGPHLALRYDYKQFVAHQRGDKHVRFGVASMLTPCEAMWERVGLEGMASACESFAGERSLHLLGIMSLIVHPERSRQFIVYIPDSQPCDGAIAGALGGVEGDPTLSLRLIRSDLRGRLRLYQQENVIASRKQVVPCLIRHLEGE
jgi:inorganic pyrophosphatase/exopolyphosphatase